MPYSITTHDGITISDVPDEMAPDAPELKQRVAQMRSQGTQAPAGPPKSKAPGSGFAMGLRDPVDAGAQLLRRAVPDSIGNAVDTFGNWLASKGMPVAPSNGVQGVDTIVRDVNQDYEHGRRAKAQTLSGLVTGEQPEPGFDWARLGGNLANPVNYVGGAGAAGAQTVRQLAVAGAKAGAVSGAMQPVVDNQANFWTEKGGQLAAGAAAGAVAAPIIGKAAEAGARKLGELTARGAASPQTIRVQVTNILRSEGMDAAQAPREILDSVERQVQQALQAGQRLDPRAIVRRAQFEAVGLTGDAAPTLGQLTRDPMQWANEKNLSGVRIRTPQGEGNPLATRFQTQNNRLGEVFDNVGARQATDRVTAGQSILESLRAADAPVRGNVDDLYTAARNMAGGRSAPLDHGTFSQAANRALDDGMLGHYVPPEIRSMLNDVTAGRQPFTVEAAEQFDSIMAAAQRRAGQGSPQSMAIGRIRQALHDAPFMPAAAAPAGESAAAAAARTVDDVGAPIVDAPFRNVPAGPALPAPAGGALATRQAGAVSFEIPQVRSGAGGAAAGGAADEGAAAREAFAQARAAARQRFATIEQTPALRAALDRDAPDDFVRRYIIGADVRDLQSMRRVLENSPEALAQARAQIAAHLRGAAFGPNAAGDAAFAPDRYMRTLEALGSQKLGVFFTPAEMVRLNLAGRVAADVSSRPAGAQYAVNGSGTAGALMNLLSKISESPLLRRIPGSRALANQVGEIRTEQEITRALSAQPPQAARELSPEVQRALRLLFTPASVAGGVLAGAAVN